MGRRKEGIKRERIKLDIANRQEKQHVMIFMGVFDVLPAASPIRIFGVIITFFDS
jgi:hypothetical protein